MNKKFAVISSTGASVVNAVYKNTERAKFNIDLIIVDRECGALSFAKDNNIYYEIAEGDGASEISSSINKILKNNKIDYAYLFYTRLLKGSVIDDYAGRIINFHPSLLPACPGLHGFEDTIKSGALMAGSTVHFVDSGIDTGQQIQQTFTPISGKNINRLRHVIFAQQCASLFYLHKKIVNDSLHTPDDGEISLHQGFIPNIDSESFSLYSQLVG